MNRLTVAILLTLGAMFSAPAAWAEDLAVILANEYYRNHPRVQDSGAIFNLENDFRRAGFSVLRFQNVESNFDDSQADDLLRRIGQAERLIVVLSGHVVRANDEGWLLHSDAGRVNALSVGRGAIPLRTFMDLAADRPGDAIVAIAAASQNLSLGAGVQVDYVPARIGQGVTVLTGSLRQIASVIANDLLVPGRPMSLALRNQPNGLRAFGYIPRSAAFLPGGSFGQDRPVLESALWQNAVNDNSISGYESFLRQFPNGQYAAEARQRLDDLRLTPQDRAQIAEESLQLNRDQRRSIQRNLTLLGYETYGVDGIFGNRTRTAIANWQRSIGVSRTGFLNANQISRLEVAAATRAEQLRREAEQRRQIEEQRDRQYWLQTGSSGTEEGLHTYLQRYPDGLYSEQAVEALRVIERQQRRLAEAAEREAWDRAVIEGTLESYQDYLNQYPNGRFSYEAQARIQSLSNPETPPQVVEAAKQEESRMNLNSFNRKLIEFQLRASNLDPGPVDGNFTRDTRRALRQFQRANSLVVTGFVTKETIVLLLASAVGR